MRITEPVTALTDYVLALLGAYFAVQLFRAGQASQQLSVLLWGAAVAAMALAAACGGTSHGFALHFNEAAKVAVWKATVYSVGLASLFLLAGTIVATTASPLRRWLLAAVVAKFLVYALWMATHDDFKYVIYDYAPSVLLALVLLAARGGGGASWIMGGIALSFAGAGIQQSGFTLHRHFNHNDLYHVIQMAALWLFARGAALLRDR